MDLNWINIHCKKYYRLFRKAVVLLLLPFIVKAQQPDLSFDHINLEQGLSNSTVEAILQDSYGFMWFATRNGLNRYDGYEMTVYTNNPNDTTTLSDDYIRCIYEDKEGNLWIGTDDGLNRFNRQSNSFTRFKHQSGSYKSISSNIITCITGDASGNLWVGTQGGLNLFDRGNSFILYRHGDGNTESISNDTITYLFIDKRNQLWVSTSGGLNRYNKPKNAFSSFLARQPGSNKITAAATDDLGNFWLGTEDNGITIFNPDSQTFEILKHENGLPGSLASNQVKSVICDHKGQIWIGAINGGLDLLRPKEKLFYHYQNNADEPKSLSQRTVSALFEDNQQNLWVGTHRGGLNFCSPVAHKFALYRPERGTNSLSYGDVKSFCEDNKGNIWIGTDGGGLNMFNGVKKLFTHYKSNPLKGGSLGSDAVLDIMQDKIGNLWIATWGGGLNLLKPGQSNFKQFTSNGAAGSISSNFIQKTYQDHEGRLWVATYYGGLNSLNPATGKFSRFTGVESTGSHISGNNIISVAEDAKLNLWIGTDDGGLNCYTKKNGHISHYFDTEEKKPDIRVLFTDRKGRFWAGQKGLYLFDETKNKFFIYTYKAGLSDEFIKGITEDGQGTLWISTSNGLTQFDPDTQAFKKYNTGDGLQGMEFEANACLKTKTGQMYFGGLNGFNSFYPGQIVMNTFIPPVYITGFQLFNKKIIAGDTGSPVKTDLPFVKEIHLSSNQSTFSFTFSALNYTTTENNRYAYKLEGFENEWNYAGKERKASYTNIGPGEYFFHVRASNNDGLWNDAGNTLTIIISPPFWRTSWFMTLASVAFISLLYLFYHYRKNLAIQKLQEQKKEEIHQVQLQFFTNISHEFKTPLTLILGPLEKLIKEDTQALFSHTYKVMYRNAQRLMSLINELMDFRKLESGALQLKVMPGNLTVFLEEIADEFCDWAAQKNIHFTVNCGGELGEAWFDRQILEKIVLNLLNNSFKYTQKGDSVSVEILQSLENFRPSFENELIIKGNFKAEKRFYIRIADTGIGISKESIPHLFERYFRITESHLGSGIGLAFVKNLTLLHKGEIYVYSQRHKGTEIIIGLPFEEKNYTLEEKWTAGAVGNFVKIESLAAIAASQQGFQQNVPTSNDLQKENTAAVMPQHILVTEDNEDVRDFLHECLCPYYKVSLAVDGIKGYALAKESMPDLVISDIMMPGMNGIDFCRKIKQDAETSHIPFIMLTAKHAIESQKEGLSSGADHYFSKPINIDLLLLTIRNIFYQRQKQKDNYTKDYYAETIHLVHTEKDRAFMDDLLKIIDAELANPAFDIDDLCNKIGMSRTKLYQKIKAISGQSIGDFIRTVRLKKAVEIITHEDVSLTEVMYRIGIQTQSYFTKAFKKEFGKTPSQFLQELKNHNK